MNPTKPVDTDLAIAQWEQLRDVYRRLGHVVDTLVPNADLPDMVFTANGATVIDGRALVSRFRHVERAAEAASYLRWLPTAGLRNVRQATFTNEGEGDHAVVGGRILAGAGFRSDQRGHAETRAYFRREVISLRLVDPRYYHLDTALAVLDAEQIIYYPPAFSTASQSVLGSLFPNAIKANDADAAAFGLNAVSDGHHVVVPHVAGNLIAQLRRRGYEPVGVDLSELLKGGGGVKCCTLELRGQPSGERS